MERVLTDGEKFSIAYALKKQQKKLLDTANKILAGNGQGVNSSDDHAPIHEEWVRHANRHREAADAHNNLANFILRNKVTVNCIVTIPEQL